MKVQFLSMSTVEQCLQNFSTDTYDKGKTFPIAYTIWLTNGQYTKDNIFDLKSMSLFERIYAFFSIYGVRIDQIGK